MNVNEDEARILTVPNLKKMHIDSMISTTHFFKKAVMIPTQTKLSARSQSLAFTRGIMNFDDYNYAAYNKHVLLQEPNNPSVALDDLESRISVNKGLAQDKVKLSETEVNWIDKT